MELLDIEEAVSVHRPYISEPHFYLQECFEEGSHQVPFSQEKFGVEICVGLEPELIGNIPHFTALASRNNFASRSRPQTSAASIRVEFRLLEDSTEYMESDYNALDWSSRGSDLTEYGV